MKSNKNPCRCLGVLDDDVAEAETEALADGTEAALETGAEELLSAATVDHEGAQTRSDLPDVRESDAGKLTAPAQSEGQSAEDGQHVVAAVLGAVEAAVGALPHAVDAVSTVGLGQNILKSDPDVVVKVVGIPVQ